MDLPISHIIAIVGWPVVGLFALVMCIVATWNRGLDITKGDILKYGFLSIIGGPAYALFYLPGVIEGVSTLLGMCFKGDEEVIKGRKK